jgi:hypothetical protein
MMAACERVAVPLDRIEDITAGCVNVAHEGMRARHLRGCRPRLPETAVALMAVPTDSVTTAGICASAPP